MSKYVLSPSGKIINESGQKKEASEVSEVMLRNQNDFFNSRRNESGSRFVHASTSLNVSPGYNPGKGIVDENIKPVFEADEDGNQKLFPSKSNNLLVNPSFGAEEGKPFSYYMPYNSIFSKNDSNSRIYAEELEMLSGFELNSLGFIGLDKNADLEIELTDFIFVFDFIIESIAYLATYWVFTNINVDKNSPISKYFQEILNVPKKMYRGNILDLISYFIVGFDKFINTDPKLPSLSKQYKDKNLFGELSVGVIPTYLYNTLTNLSKIERKRTFLLIRKFQQESYWHTEILYKAKTETSETFVDKFFVEFSQYYFKFILERINIGYITLTTKHTAGKKFSSASNSRHFDSFTDVDSGEYIGNFDGSAGWKWQPKVVEDSYKKDSHAFNKTAISSLPNLLKSNEYFRSVNPYSKDNAIGQNFAVTKERRLPISLVNEIEKYMENEYMPFYMHDLRTNEVLTMHAFLDNISESFSPEYTSSSGYGRIDDVKHYIKTTRSINLGFTLYATRPEEFDLMWYQINKIVSMVYPQWSQGIPANTGRFKSNKDFRFPFTQVPTSSPLIRLRVGDVLKSNFTFESLKRLHGNKKKKHQYENAEVVSLNKGTVFSIIKNSDSNRTSEKTNGLIEVAEHIESTADESYVDIASKSDILEKIEDTRILGKKINLENKKYSDGEVEMEIVDPKELTNLGYFGYAITTTVFGDNIIVPQPSVKQESSFQLDLFKSLSTWFYIVKFTLKTGINNTKDAFDINNLSSVLTNNNGLNNKSGYLFVVKRGNLEGSITTWEDTVSSNITKSSITEEMVETGESFERINNPYTKAFETASGKGLAGFITNLDMNYQEYVWNTSSPGSNAPHGVKITLGFSPIHDIPPGLDHEGIMRAPVYNIGSINKKIFGG